MKLQSITRLDFCQTLMDAAPTVMGIKKAASTDAIVVTLTMISVTTGVFCISIEFECQKQLLVKKLA